MRPSRTPNPCYFTSCDDAAIPRVLVLARRRPSTVVRMVAGVLLAAVALWFAPQPVSARSPASHGCSMSADVAGVSTLVPAAADEPPCHHAGYAGCPLTPACTAGAPAVPPGHVELALGGREAALDLPQVRSLAGLVDRGPPTPPPNS
jgi:hypothetical protein